VELSRQKQDGWGMRPASSSVGRRRIPFARREQTSRVSSAASEDASPLEEPNDAFVVKQKTASNPYGYAWWKLILAVLATAAFFYHFNTLETQMHALQASDLPKITVPDKWPWPNLRSPTELEATFRILGDAGRAVYKRYLMVDLFFPLAYTFLYSQLLGFLVVWSQFWARLAKRLFPTWVGALAYTVFPFDLLENAAIAYVLLHPGAHNMAALSGYFTWVKFLLVVVNVTIMYIGLTLGVFDFVFKLLRRRYDGLSAVIYSLAQR